MKIIDKLTEKNNKFLEADPVTIAFYGDSVTQGCFEVYRIGPELRTIFDSENSFHAHFRKILSKLYPRAPLNIINAGVCGTSASNSLPRLERDVLRFSPDLTVVSFGLNDSSGEEAGLDNYRQALKEIFVKLQEKGSEIIFLTPNMMNTKVSPLLNDDELTELAKIFARRQNEGIMDLYMQTAREVCEEFGVTVCDCYKKWQIMDKSGVDITELLSNKLNHPTREMNWLAAMSLIETIFMA